MSLDAEQLLNFLPADDLPQSSICRAMLHAACSDRMETRCVICATIYRVHRPDVSQLSHVG